MYLAISITAKTDQLNSDNTYHDGEDELLRQLSSGSENAFREIFERYRGKLYHYILKITGSEAAAEDAVHDVFLKLWEAREKLPQIQHFSSYLFRMARNHAINGFRRMSRETLMLAELRHDTMSITPDIDPVTQKEIRESIRKAVAKLTPRQQKIFLLSREHGLKHEAIAEQLGISVNTVKVHMTEALRFLREEIGHSYGPLAVAIYVMHRIF